MFWENFLALCVKIGKTPNNVCKELGFSNATATHWKQGAKPGSTSIKKISDFFCVSESDLLSDSISVKREADPQEETKRDRLRRLLDELSDEDLEKLEKIIDIVKKEK